MIITKVFGAGGNRQERIEKALYRFLFPAKPGLDNDSDDYFREAPDPRPPQDTPPRDRCPNHKQRGAGSSPF
ncbi:MAG: hypothetical protein M1489_06270 [Firmicutes bacterium]|nr:hypothetical protein [Bacillota bacterium]